MLICIGDGIRDSLVNSGSFDGKTSILCKFYAKRFVVQNKHITFELRSSSSLQGIAKTSFVSALA